MISDKVRTLPEQAITRGTVQTPGAIVGTSGQSLCLSPCSVHVFPLSFKSSHWESSVQYFDKCSPTSSAISWMSSKFKYYWPPFRTRIYFADTLAVRTMQATWRIQKTIKTLLSCLTSLIAGTDITICSELFFAFFFYFRLDLEYLLYPRSIISDGNENYILEK